MTSSYVARLCEISAILNNAISIPSLSKKNKFSKQLWLTVQYVTHHYCRWPGTTRCWGICRHSDICQSIEINNKYVYRQSQVRKSTDSGVKWAECSLIIGTGCRVQVFAWSSIAESVCQRAFSLLAIWCLGPRVQILHSAEEHNLSPFDLNIACLCQGNEINNKYVYTYTYTYTHTYMFVVNFDVLAQASDFRIENRQVVFLCWMQDSKLGSQTECPLTNRLSYRGSSWKHELNSQSLWWMSIQPTSLHCRSPLCCCRVCFLTVHTHDDVIKWKHFPRYWPFVRGIHRSPVKSPHNGQWRGALMFSLICAWMNGWVNTRVAGD